jgi:hypothetical protein
MKNNPDFHRMSLARLYKIIVLISVFGQVLIKSLAEILELGFQDGNKRYEANKPYSHPHAILIHRVTSLPLEAYLYDCVVDSRVVLLIKF